MFVFVSRVYGRHACRECWRVADEKQCQADTQNDIVNKERDWYSSFCEDEVNSSEKGRHDAPTAATPEFVLCINIALYRWLPG